MVERERERDRSTHVFPFRYTSVSLFHDKRSILLSEVVFCWDSRGTRSWRSEISTLFYSKITNLVDQTPQNDLVGIMGSSGYVPGTDPFGIRLSLRSSLSSGGASFRELRGSNLIGGGRRDEGFVFTSPQWKLHRKTTWTDGRPVVLYQRRKPQTSGTEDRVPPRTSCKKIDRERGLGSLYCCFVIFPLYN